MTVSVLDVATVAPSVHRVDTSLGQRVNSL